MNIINLVKFHGYFLYFHLRGRNKARLLKIKHQGVYNSFFKVFLYCNNYCMIIKCYDLVVLVTAYYVLLEINRF